MRAEGHLHEVVAESRDSVHVVCEGALGHLHRRLALGLGTIDRTWLGELKFQLPPRSGSKSFRVSICRMVEQSGME